MKRTLLFLFCALISTQMFSGSSSPYGTATSFAKTDVASTTFNNDIEAISSDLRKKYLVEKITWYDDETNHKEAYYEYDNNNRLVRRIIHNTYFEQGRVKHDTIVDNYEYTEGNLTKISHKDVYVSYTYDLEYDNVGRLITSKYVNNIMHFCYRGGKMDSIWYDNDPECYTILKYDEHGNIVKEINRVPEMDDIWEPTGNYVFRENEYEYDDKIRPFFNIDNAFVYDPFFGQGTTHSEYISMLSTNNLIKYSRYSWHYTYNEEGLPIELRRRFEGVTPVNDPKYVFTYRKIEKTESLADLFPTLWGLQRTACSEYTDCEENVTYLMQFDEIKEINGKQYLKSGGIFLREEDNKVLIYSFPYEKDLVLYDWTLEIGDTLQNLGIDPYSFPELEYAAIVDYIAYEDYDEEIGDFIIKKEPLGKKRVKDISTIRLLDGNEYKAWLFGYDWERGKYYVEGIGNANKYGGDYVDLAHPFAVPTCYYGERLVCVSRDGVLLYQIDDAEMERLGTDCLCDGYQSSYKDQWSDTWNVLSHAWDPEGGDDMYYGYTIIYQLGEDTLINEVRYRKLTGYFSLASPSMQEYVAALRFADDKKVFIHYDNTEYLLYDFGAQVGDTLEIFGGIDHYKDFKILPHVITGIDTLADGRLQIYSNAIIQESEGYETPFERLYPKIWIEGVGSKDGIVQNSATNRIGSGTSVLLCAYYDDDCIYTTDNPYYTSLGCVYNDPIFSATEEVESPTPSAQKVIQNGQLLILHDGKTYNVMGMEVTK